MADRLPVALHAVVALPLVGVDHSRCFGKAVHVRAEPLSVGTPKNAQAHLPGGSTDRADNRRTVVAQESLRAGAMPTSLVGASGLRDGSAAAARHGFGRRREVQQLEG